MVEGIVLLVLFVFDGLIFSVWNFLGFCDGLVNFDSNDVLVMDCIVWVGEGELVWVQGGSYQVVCIICNFVECWDCMFLGEQECIMGCVKYSGVFLD